MEKLKKLCRRYFIDAMSAMAHGLFASLLIGTILSALGMIPGLSFLDDIGKYAKAVAGPAMAVAIAFSLKAHPLVIYSSAAVGWAANAEGGGGGPLAVLIITIIAVEIGMLVSKKTKVDIVVTPFVTVLIGGGLALLIGGYFGMTVDFLKTVISNAMTLQPLMMGIVVSVIIGMVLTLPISSAALCAALILTGMGQSGTPGLALAGGAAVAGCCAQMVGFAFMSFRENKWEGLLSQGLGTSMLQMSNIMRRPMIWIPPIAASAVGGALSAGIFRLSMYSEAIYSGMGTCALLGPIGIILGWFGGEYPEAVTAFDWAGLALICFIVPVVVSVGLGELFRKLGWIREGDLKLR